MFYAQLGSYETKKHSVQNRTAAERNHVAESDPPQAENFAGEILS